MKVNTPSLFTKHPFSVQFDQKIAELSSFQKRVVILTSLASLIFIGIGAPIAFIGLSYYFRHRKIQELKQKKIAEAQEQIKKQNLEIEAEQRRFQKTIKDVGNLILKEIEKKEDEWQGSYAKIDLNRISFQEVALIVEKALKEGIKRAPLEKFNQWLELHKSINVLALTKFLNKLLTSLEDAFFAEVLKNLSFGTRFSLSNQMTLSSPELKKFFYGLVNKGPATQSIFHERLEEFSLRNSPFYEDLISRLRN